VKLAIVTIYDSFINFGSYLQAFALKEILEQMGHEVYFIRRMNDSDILKRFMVLTWENNRVNKGGRFFLLRFLKRKLYSILECFANLIRFYKSKQDWKQLKIITSDEAEKIGIDCYICGSDEIWNIHNKDIDLAFYTCKWLKSDNKIAYAVSSGSTLYNELDNETIKAIKQFIKIMPRDSLTKNLVDKITDKNTEIVCDPTILLGKDYFSLFKAQTRISGRYLLVYSYVYSKKQKRILRKYAKEHGLKIISPCIYADFADQIIYTSALDFPYLINNAECMYTSTYHGTIFGLMFAKKLCCLPRFEKIKSLLDSFDAWDYSVNEDFDYYDISLVLEKEVNHKKIDDMMLLMKNKSLSILNKVLSEM